MDSNEFSDAIKEICNMSNRLAGFQENHASFLDAIKALDREYLQEELGKLADHSITGKGVLRPVNFVKYVVVDRILRNQEIGIELIEEIKEHVLSKDTDYFKDYPDFKEALSNMEAKNFFKSWDNFKILFFVYYDRYKYRVKPRLSSIAEHLKITLNMKDSNVTVNDFGWNQNFGGADCWIALYPADKTSHKEAYQIFLRVNPKNNLKYGVVSGSELEAVSLLKEQDGSNVDVEKLQKYLFENAKPKYEELNDELPTSEEDEELEEVTERTPRNIILHGPPGTGKTYITYEMAVSTIEPDFKYATRKELISKYKKLQEHGNIVFITFHQSYSYEEFIEGYRYDPESKIPVVQPGIFKTLVESAKADYSSPSHKVNIDFGKMDFFKMSLGSTIQGEDDIYDYCIKENVIALGWGREIDFSPAEDREAVAKLFKEHYKPESDYDFNITAVDYFKNYMEKGDIVFISKGNRILRAIGRVTGDYFYNSKSPIRFNHFRKVEWLLVDQNIPVEKVMKKNFSQQAIYLLDSGQFIEGNIQTLLTRQSNSKIRNYVLIIDEINRGNISKIFGELITLIEEDKRLGMDNEMTARLPYSGETGFGVPPNIFIIGTMNTADRSIALMDVALRRRFKFQEIMPNAKIVIDILGEKELNQDFIEIIEKTLTILNKRIEVLLDKDHTIGHSYFLNISEDDSENDLFRVWYGKIIPLLKEYFYNDWDKLRQVLGEYRPNSRRGFIRILESDYRGIFENEYEDEYPCEVFIYSRTEYPVFSEILNNTFVKYGNEPAEE